MTSLGTRRRILPSELAARPVQPNDGPMIGRIIPPERIAEIVASGAFGHSADGAPMSLSIEQLIEACVQKWCIASLVFGASGEPLSFQYGAMVDPHTLTGGLINAPDAPRGLGLATAGLALCLDQLYFRDTAVQQVTVEVLGGNEASARMLAKLGFVRTEADANAAGADHVMHLHSLSRAEWIGVEEFERKLLAELPAPGRSGPKLFSE